MSVGVILVAGMKTDSRWVDKFIVEVYDDAAMTNRVSLKSSKATWDSQQQLNVQQDLIPVTGLTFGQQYWLRGGVQAPVSGIITWSSPYTTTAGLSNVSDSTGIQYTPHIKTTVSGIIWTIGVENVPANVSYFEAVWNNSGDTPPASTPAMATGLKVNASSEFQYFSAGAPADNISSWVRPVTTSGERGAWVFMGVGSVATSLNADSCCDCVNVADFGAVGDGTTDDTIAIQAALNVAAANAAGINAMFGAQTTDARGAVVTDNNAPVPGTDTWTITVGASQAAANSKGTIVCIPSHMICAVTPQGLDGGAGFYYGAVNVALYIDSGVTLRIDGTILMAVNSSTDSCAVLENRNAFVGGPTSTFTVASESGPRDSNILITGKGSINCQGDLQSSTGAVLAIRFCKCDDSRIENIHMTKGGDSGLYWGHSDRAEVLDCYLTGTVPPTACHTSQAGSGQFDCLRNSIISRNVVLDGVGVGLFDWACKDTQFVDNICQGMTLDGFDMQDFGMEFADFFDSNPGLQANVLVTGNTFSHNTQNGANLFGGSGTGRPTHGYVFEHNDCSFNGADGISFQGMGDSSISHNDILYNTRLGLGASSPAVGSSSYPNTNLSILHNNFSGNGVHDIGGMSGDSTYIRFLAQGSHTISGTAWVNKVLMWNPTLDLNLYTSWLSRTSTAAPPSALPVAHGLCGPASMSYTCRTQCLSQSGTSASVVIASVVVDFPDISITYAGTTVTPPGLGKYHIFVDDPWHNGSSDCVYGFTSHNYEITQYQGRVYLGTITTVGGGGAVGNGGGSNPALVP